MLGGSASPRTVADLESQLEAALRENRHLRDLFTPHPEEGFLKPLLVNPPKSLVQVRPA